MNLYRRRSRSRRRRRSRSRRRSRRRSQTKLLFKNKFITIAGKTELYSYCVGSILINEPASTLSIVYVASCKCLLLPLLSPLCLANLLFACHPLCYGLSYMSVWANSFVLCLGAAERIRLAGSRQLV